MARIGKQETYYLERLRTNWPSADWQAQYAVSNGTGTNYYLDFYSPVHKVAIEFDESHHKTRRQREKDFVRETEVKRKLSCAFYRYPEGCAYPFWMFVETLMGRLEV